jgi:hypothetical protein
MPRELILAAIGEKKPNVPGVIARAQAMSSGFGAHASDYPALSPPLPTFNGLLLNLVTAQQQVQYRTLGAATYRNEQRDLLWSAMKSECGYVQSLCDASPARGLSLIENAGLVAITRSIYTKPLLALTLGAQPGTVNCVANLSLLLSMGTTKRHQQRCLLWQYTLDGGKTFVSAGSTPGCKTVLSGLPSLTIVGVRVCLQTMRGVGAWSQVVTIVVH